MCRRSQGALRGAVPPGFRLEAAHNRSQACCLRERPSVVLNLAPPWHRPGAPGPGGRRPGPHGVWVASGEFWPDTAGHRHSWDGLPTRGANRASGARRATHRTASSVTLALRRATTAKRPAGTFPPRHRNGLSGSRPGRVELRSPAEFSRSLPRPRSAGGFTARSRTCPSTCWRPAGRWRGTG